MGAIQTRQMLVAIMLVLMRFPAVHGSDLQPTVEKIVAPYLKGKTGIGIVIGVTRPTGREVFGLGEITLKGKSQRPTGKTLFEIGSATKIFTGTLLADQILAGKVALDDSVQMHLPKGLTVPEHDGKKITLLHLATHTSSLPVQPPFFGFYLLTTKDPANPYAEYDRNKLARMLKNLTLSRPIGSQFEYSNLGVGLLGHALAHAAKTNDYETLLIREILDPLKLTDTRIKLNAEQKQRFATGHNVWGLKTSEWTFATLEAAGGLRSTADDLLIFADAALGREKALRRAFQMAHQSRHEISGKNDTVGLCWFQKIDDYKLTSYWHNGGTGGYRSFLAITLETGVGVVVLSNSANSIDQIGVALLAHLNQEQMKPKSH